MLAADFEKLNKQLAKMAVIVQKEGIPNIYWRAIIALEDAVNATQANPELKKKMSPTTSKSFNTLRQKLKKHLKPYETQIAAFRANPVGSDEEDEDDKKSSDDSDSEAEKKPAAKKGKDVAKAPSAPKKWGDESSDDEEEVARRTEEPPRRPTAATTTINTSSAGAESLPDAAIDAKLQEIIKDRGRKNISAKDQIGQLQALAVQAKNPLKRVECFLHLVSTQFDVNLNMISYTPVLEWKRAAENMMTIVNTLKAIPGTAVAGEDDVAGVHTHVDDEEIAAATAPASTEGGAVDSERVTTSSAVGNPLAFVERLGDELSKSLKFMDHHTPDYISRLQDEHMIFLPLAAAVQSYYESIGYVNKAARCAAVRVNHMYYRLHLTGKKGEEGQKAVQEYKDLFNKLCTFVFKHGDERIRMRTVLCQVYFYALHDRFHEARDLMLMSHVQEEVNRMDVYTQILFNRAMVQLGLSAFRAGFINEAFQCLQEIFSGGRIKELLAQGTSARWFMEKNPEQEKLERRRMMPYHLHINIELLECVHLICAMLLEVPNMAASQTDIKKKILSRQFRRYLDNFHRNVFTGPPENTRDSVMAAARSLATGDWKRAQALIVDLAIWNLPVWAAATSRQNMIDMLKRKIQEEALRTYLFTYSQFYQSLSLSHLAEMFELPNNQIHSIVSKMMLNQELHASWDQPTSCIIMHRVEPTRLQNLALQFAEKATIFLEQKPSGGKGGWQDYRDYNEQRSRPQYGGGAARGMPRDPRRGPIRAVGGGPMNKQKFQPRGNFNRQ
eukprot:gnl/Hemi2/25765_TR8666_c0_g2_i1.p1 gnl/Hemi2/25765_TR8666_c0_g2~~gnl/Hemi2/25765_TR8666_c0_g2_i1.p1  ORF type:complete len:872 (-),score=362.83 gnl/Hemi2/25765_TR8666_c0_g2_i1:108-2456(-)